MPRSNDHLSFLTSETVVSIDATSMSSFARPKASTWLAASPINLTAENVYLATGIAQHIASEPPHDTGILGAFNKSNSSHVFYEGGARSFADSLASSCLFDCSRCLARLYARQPMGRRSYSSSSVQGCSCGPRSLRLSRRVAGTVPAARAARLNTDGQCESSRRRRVP